MTWLAFFFSKGWKIFRRWCKGSNGTNPKCCCLLPSSGCSSQRSQTRGNILCHLQFFMFFIIWFCFHWMKCFYGHLMIHSSRKFCYSSFLWFFFSWKKSVQKFFIFSDSRKIDFLLFYFTVNMLCHFQLICDFKFAAFITMASNQNVQYLQFQCTSDKYPYNWANIVKRK